VGVNCATCKGYHQSCSANTDCCTDNCVAGKCEQAPSACLLVGTVCAPNSSPGCCSGLCERDPGGVYRCMETNECDLPNQSCSHAADCCSDYCSGGSCATSGSCVQANGNCSVNADCCNDNCVSGKCVTRGTGCTTLGESCTSSSNCCSGFCEIA